jgi:hypothetical protein
MKLSGMISKVMDNYICLRGIAGIKTFAEMSEVNPDIQRNLLEEHKDEMKDFLERGEYAFFPEVVLSMDVGLTEENKKFEDLVATIDSADRGFINKVGNVRINFRVDKNKLIDDRRKLKVAQIEFDETKVRLSRIDGNHRLSAAEYLQNDILIPFCLTIFSSKNEAENNSRAIFHNINSKQIPLKLEQNLKIIIESSDVFTNEKLEKSQPFGIHYKFTRELLCGERKIDFVCFPHVEKFIQHSKYSFFVDLFRNLLKEKLVNEDSAVITVKKELISVENALDETNILTSSQNSAIIGALAYYRLADKTKFKRFIKWIERNHISEAESVGLDDIISIFDKVYDNIPKKVFLARWYPASTDPNYNKAVQRRKAIGMVLDELNLQLIDFATQDGGTYDIRSAMYKEISESDIFIADLTGCRHNVMVEVGCALSSNKLNFDQLNPEKGRMLFYFAPTDEYKDPPFDLSGFRYEKIDDSSEIETKVRPLIESILDEM